MASKLKTLTVDYLCPNLANREPTYRVIRVTDSLDFAPGAILGKRTVEELCESPHWKVIVHGRD
jgi:hypothetical protein